MDERGVMDEHRYIKAAELLDPTKTLPCLCYDGYGAFCGQALRWPRHPRDHDFVGLASLLRIVVAEERARVRHEEVGPLVDALKNCRGIAARAARRKGADPDWQHVLRYCSEVGVEGSILRGAPEEVS